MAISQKKLKSLAYVFLSLTVLFIIAVILIPIIIKKSVESKYRDKTIQNQFNINLWAKFPGDIKSKTTHTFKILDYSEESLKIKDSVVLEEKTAYDKFEFDKNNNKIKFDAISEFKMDEPKPKNDTIKTMDLGMFETLEYFSNPSQYQIGINSILYLFNKVLITPDLFIRKIFSYNLFTRLLNNETKVRETILNNIEKEKADKILSNEEIYKSYTFKKLSGFYNWIKILNIQEKIKNSKWLYDLFGLSENDINSILGNDSYLYKEYITFNSELANRFDCFDNKLCGNEIFYKQLLSGEVLKYYELNNITYLYQMINPDLYPFKNSPELFIFFKEFKQKIKKQDIKYEDYAPNFNQLYNMLEPSTNISLLSSKISALFLMINNTKDIDKANQIYKNISLNNILFISDYIYNYLPKLLIYQEIDNNTKIEKFAHAFLSITQNNIVRTYGLLRKFKDIFNFMLNNLVWNYLTENNLLIKSMINNDLKNFDNNDLCPLIMQLALDDGRKVLKICSDPKTSFNSSDTLNKWFAPYYCIIKNETGCDMSIIDHLKTIVYITDDEIKKIYDKNYLGGAFEFIDQSIKKEYNCSSGDTCDDEYLRKLQFWKSGLTKNLPIYKTDTLYELFPDKFPYPVEMYYFAKKMNYTDNINEKDIDNLIKLYYEDENILDEENAGVFNNRIDMEKSYTLKKDIKNETIFNVMHLLNKGFLFGKEIIGDYQNLYNILQGNYMDDKKYIDFLSNGNLYEGFKPNLNQSTGFNFGFNLSNGNLINKEYDKYEISAKEDNLRRIMNINNFQILNLKKMEYDYISKDYISITTQLYNYEFLNELKHFSDGFQYDSSSEIIYLYDKISSRPFKFIYKNEDKYNDIDCKKYELDKNDISSGINELIDLNSNYAFLSQKMNKPFIVTIGKGNLNINENIEEDNYICVDPFTNEVIQSKLNLIYSIYSKDYGYINSNIENKKAYPIIIYQKLFEVDKDSYNDYFPDIKVYNNFRLIFLIIGISLIIIFAIVTLIIFIKIHKNLVDEELNSATVENPINSSRDPTIMNESLMKKE